MISCGKHHLLAYLVSRQCPVRRAFGIMNGESANGVVGHPSSSLTPPPSSDLFTKQGEGSSVQHRYRSARELPFELAQHVQNYCEEALFTRAFEHLLSTTANSISSTNLLLPAIIPPSNQITLAATVAVHPMFTSRTTSSEKHSQANAALRLLRLILKVVGPVNLRCTDCFKFRRYDDRFYTREDEDSKDDLGRLNTRYASSDSIYSRVDDFWSIVGWAFNCACLSDMYTVRWEYWKLWLSYMVDLLETDWQLRSETQSCEESLIWQYIELASGGHGRARRILRAIFADGSTKSLNEFREVFNNELKPPRTEDTDIRKRKVDVNVDNEIFGDYLENDDSDFSDPEPHNFRSSKRQRARTPSTRRTTPRTSSGTLRSDYEADTIANPSEAISTLGPTDCIRLRLRLMQLLSHISGHPTLLSTSPTTFPDLADLYTLFVEFIRPLPLPVFSDFISPGTQTEVLSKDAHISLCEVILQRMLESAAPIGEENYLTERKMREDYFPWAAGKNTVEAQAKVALLLEALVRRCANSGMWNGLSSDEKQALWTAVEVGIERREAVAMQALENKKGRRGGRKGVGDAEEEAWKWLRESAARMRMVVRSLK